MQFRERSSNSSREESGEFVTESQNLAIRSMLNFTGGSEPVSLCLTSDLLIFLAINQGPMEREKERGRRKEERSNQFPPCWFCECRSDRQLPFAMPTPSRRAAVQTEVIFVNVRDAILHVSLPETLLGGRRRRVDRALFRQLNELPGRLHVFREFGRQRRCLLGMGLHASTHSALSQFAQASRVA